MSRVAAHPERTTMPAAIWRRRVMSYEVNISVSPSASSSSPRPAFESPRICSTTRRPRRGSGRARSCRRSNSWSCFRGCRGPQRATWWNREGNGEDSSALAFRLGFRLRYVFERAGNVMWIGADESGGSPEPRVIRVSEVTKRVLRRHSGLGDEKQHRGPAHRGVEESAGGIPPTCSAHHIAGASEELARGVAGRLEVGIRLDASECYPDGITEANLEGAFGPTGEGARGNRDAHEGSLSTTANRRATTAPLRSNRTSARLRQCS